jgi:hypothetical protein
VDFLRFAGAGPQDDGTPVGFGGRDSGLLDAILSSLLTQSSGIRRARRATSLPPNSRIFPFIDEKTHAVDYLEAHAKDENPFFMYVNTAKLHQPNLPHPDFEGKSMGKSKYLDSLVELDHNVGLVIDKVRELGIAENTLIVWTTDNGAWQDVYPDCGYTPFKGTKGTDYEGGSRVPAIAWWPGTIEPGRRNSEIVGSFDFMATFASLAGIELPTEDRDGQPTIFDSCDQTALLRGEGPSTRDHWFYMTETELIPGAVRVGKWKAIWNIRTGWMGAAAWTHPGLSRQKRRTSHLTGQRSVRSHSKLDSSVASGCQATSERSLTARCCDSEARGKSRQSLWR